VPVARKSAKSKKPKASKKATKSKAKKRPAPARKPKPPARKGKTAAPPRPPADDIAGIRQRLKVAIAQLDKKAPPPESS